MTWWRQRTPVGDIVVVAGDGGVVSIHLQATPGLTPAAEPPEHDDAIAAELDEYFAGRRRRFSVRPDLSGLNDSTGRLAAAQGTCAAGARLSFRRRVLETLTREVAWGETVTYGELADMVGAPHAARAVGTAMAKNPVPILVPCHRVLAANGIGGYGLSGVPMKRALLAIEGVHVP